jgi:hypothetical protein
MQKKVRNSSAKKTKDAKKSTETRPTGRLRDRQGSHQTAPSYMGESEANGLAEYGHSPIGRASLSPSQGRYPAGEADGDNQNLNNNRRSPRSMLRDYLIEIEKPQPESIRSARADRAIANRQTRRLHRLCQVKAGATGLSGVVGVPLASGNLQHLPYTGEHLPGRGGLPPGWRSNSGMALQHRYVHPAVS